MSRFLHQLYNAALNLAYPALSRLKAKHRRARPARMGLKLPEVAPGGIWVHGLSVGEVISARPLLTQLGRTWPELTVNLSATTETGLDLARREAVAGRCATAFQYPADLNRAVERVLDKVRPQGVILVETDIWPNFLEACGRRGIPTALVNFRVSPKRRRSEQRLRSFFGQVYGHLNLICFQSELDQRRFAGLGVSGPVTAVTGNLKYDQPPPRPIRPEELGLDPVRPILVAGSTHPGEEEIVLRVWERLAAEVPGLGLAVAPRNPERFEEVARLMTRQERPPGRLSRGETLNPEGLLLIDRLGVLAGFYGLARAAFVGGSLVELGGHNILEPAAQGVPVAFGPHMANFREITDRVLAQGGGALVADPLELESVWRRWLIDPELAGKVGRAGQAVYLANQGAARRTVELIGRVFGWKVGR